MDKKKNDFLFIIIFIVITSISLFYLSNASYAKYKRQVEAEVQNKISSWNIKVNNESINNQSTLTTNIEPTLENSQYVKEGTLAPGTKGYFDIIINAEDVDVDFTYKITTKANEETPLLDLIITGFEVNNEEQNLSEGNVITGEIIKNSSDTTLRIYFEWNDDDESNTMNNEEDTEYAINPDNKYTKLHISIEFAQKK